MAEETSVARRPSVVIIDDQSTGRRILERIIRSIDPELQVETYSDPFKALSRIRSCAPDLIVTDYKMPAMDGIALIRHVRSLPACADIPIIVVTVVEDVRIRYAALDAGATDFLSRPIDQYECRARCRNLLTLRRQQQIIRNRASWLEDQVALATREVQARERETLLRLAKAGEYRDQETGNHVLRMARYARLIAEALSLARGECEEIELAAPMHDIGKIGIPDCILLKEGPLNEKEFGVMKTHTRIGYEILKDSPSRRIILGATIALCHHERYDGLGYPDGLAGEAIPLPARIVAVCDVYDALTSTRPYKGPWPAAEAIRYIRERAGTQFDPGCVESFLARTREVQQVQRELEDGKMMRQAAGEGQPLGNSDGAKPNAQRA
jgi:two-component system response regulator RpfG